MCSASSMEWNWLINKAGMQSQNGLERLECKAKMGWKEWGLVNGGGDNDSCSGSGGGGGGGIFIKLLTLQFSVYSSANTLLLASCFRFLDFGGGCGVVVLEIDDGKIRNVVYGSPSSSVDVAMVVFWHLRASAIH
uniref:Uncharacterized protein n=1 Tax=Lactuca sativa TaxID=4236 RepID=A0A9R1X0S9_LACSA|nr:hypothetical protein LSAT_V11C800421480 [Lactuca sativa]